MSDSTPGLVGPAPVLTLHGNGCTYYCVGNPQDAPSSAIEAGLMLMGGGENVDPAFEWLLRCAKGGDVVVLRARGDDAYNEYMFGHGQVDSVETLVIDDDRGAWDDFVVDKVRRAEAIFIAGGNQWDYVRQWKGTPLGQALRDAARRGVPIGGTSAGLAIMGEHVFTAEHDTVTSEQCLADPHDPRLTLADDFLHLPHLQGVITDTHFHARDRMGRLLAFMERVMEDRGTLVCRAIAVDERTALLVDTDGIGRVSGEACAYFLQAHAATARHDGPLTLHQVAVVRLAPGGRFDLERWAPLDGAEVYTLDVDEGRLTSSRPDGSIY